MKHEHTTTAVAHIKRFLERLRADPSFREDFRNDPERAVQKYQIQVNPEEIRPLWDPKMRGMLEEQKDPSNQAPELSESVRAYQQFVQQKLAQRDTILKEATPTEPRFQAWRNRQMAKLSSVEYSDNDKPSNVHIPICFELSKGCSVGCWFCSLDPPPLSSIFEYSDANAQLWQACLKVVKTIIGPAAGRGFCYWATEPFDHPDYEKFCSDFHHILGHFPQTTTALPLKDPARTRLLLQLSKKANGEVNRFSILSLEHLNKVHAEFTAEELLWVELVTQNQDADLIKCKSGRFRNACERNPEIWNKETEKFKRNVIKANVSKDAFDDLLERRTTACVTGFLVNMVDKRIALVSPCIPDDTYPLGFITHDEASFVDADHFSRLIKGMIDRYMTLTITDLQLIRFRADLGYECLPDGFRLSTPVKTFTFINQQYGTYFKELGELLHDGKNTVNEIAVLCRYKHGIAEINTFVNIQQFFCQGFLAEAADRSVKVLL